MTNFKRAALGGAGVLILVSCWCLLPTSNHYRYQASSRVVAKPYTKALYERPFETYVIQTCPGVHRLEVSGAKPVPGAPALTNGVMIRLIALGATSEDAQRAANEAARRVCSDVLTNYGAAGVVVDRASAAFSYSPLLDEFRRDCERLFKR